MYNFDTKNKSCIVLAHILQKLGVKNYFFFLKLINPKLVDIDPFNENLTKEEQLWVRIECILNPWYFFREIVRIPDSKTGFFILHLGNLAMIWLSLLSINYIIVLGRQAFKSQTLATIATYIVLFGGEYSNEIILGNTDKLAKNNLERVKAVIDSLPDYLKPTELQKSKYNTEIIKIYKTPEVYNSITVKAAGNTEESANVSGRGGSYELIVIDEIAWTKHNKTLYETIIYSYSTVADAAAANGRYHGIVMATTAGDPETPYGKWMWNFIQASANFDVQLYDFTYTNANNEYVFDIKRIKDYLEINASNKTFFYITYDYKALGKGDDYITKAFSSVDLETAAREVLNIWLASVKGHPLGKNTVIQLVQKAKQHTSVITLRSLYFLKLYFVDIEYLKKNSKYLICTVDCSGNTEGDYSTLVIGDVRDRSVKATMRVNSYTIVKFAEVLSDIFTDIVPNSPILIERNYVGIVVIQMLQNQYGVSEKRFIRDEDTKFGIVMDKALRSIIYGDVLRTAVITSSDYIYDSNIISEITTLERTSSGRIDHRADSHDDMLIAYLYFQWFILHYEEKYRYIPSSAFDAMREGLQIRTSAMDLLKFDEVSEELVQTRQDLLEKYGLDTDNEIVGEVDMKQQTNLFKGNGNIGGKGLIGTLYPNGKRKVGEVKKTSSEMEELSVESDKIQNISVDEQSPEIIQETIIEPAKAKKREETRLREDDGFIL